jgi:hypothetical protein
VDARVAFAERVASDMEPSRRTGTAAAETFQRVLERDIWVLPWAAWSCRPD